jgi:hypothetical protein
MTSIKIKNIIVLYPGGFHGEFFIGNIVSITDKFNYCYFKCRSEKLNAYQYEAIEHLCKNGEPLIAPNQTDEIRSHSYGSKPIIFRTQDFSSMHTLPLVNLYTKDLMYNKRGVLLQCIKSLDKYYSNIDGVPCPPPITCTTTLGSARINDFVVNHTTDKRVLHVDIKEWLHNKNLEKIEDFFQIEYTQAMKDAVTQYYQRDNVLLDKYFPNWQNQSDEHLLKEMSRIDKEYAFNNFKYGINNIIFNVS